jgi:hypothetical protein
MWMNFPKQPLYTSDDIIKDLISVQPMNQFMWLGTTPPPTFKGLWNEWYDKNGRYDK